MIFQTLKHTPTTLKPIIVQCAGNAPHTEEKQNTYAKSETGLQRVLNLYWVIHNFVRVHFTTKEVPAVTLGVIESSLTAGKTFQRTIDIRCST